jgi:DNA polymerase elongation subunit (family B)
VGLKGRGFKGAARPLQVVSKSLSQDPDQYNAKAAHVELASRMRERDPATGPAVGDRIPYVIIKGHKTSKAYERGEHPRRLCTTGLGWVGQLPTTG